MAVVVKYLSYEDLKELKQAFQKYDITKSGFLTIEEVTQALNQGGHNYAKEQIEEIIRNTDVRGDGRINYSEFIAATLSSKSKLTE